MSSSDANGEAADSSLSPPARMSRREEINLKREQKKREEESQYSYKPNIPRRKSASEANGVAGADANSPVKAEEGAAAATVDPFTRMYSDARKKQEEQKKAVVKPEYTFKPNIPGSNKDKDRAKSPLQTSARLYQTPARKEVHEEPKPSFKPQISKRAKSLERNANVSTADRLYAQAVIAKEKQEKLRESVLKQEEQNNTFAPNIHHDAKGKSNTTTAPERSAPISERMQRYIEERNKKLEEARKEKEAKELAEITLKPKISSSKTEKNSESTKNVFDRLAHHEKPVIAEEEAPSFQPTMFTAKRAASAGKARRSVGSSEEVINANGESIHERLYREAEQRRRELAAERDLARQEEEKQLTFTPQISGRAESFEVSKSNGEVVSVFKRLNSINKEDIVQKNEQLKIEHELEDCTFRPAINTKSADLIKAAEPVHIRLTKEAERQREVKKMLDEQKVAEELQDCTFAPDLTKSASFGYQKRRHSGDLRRGNEEDREETHASPVKSPAKPDSGVSPNVKAVVEAVAAASLQTSSPKSQQATSSPQKPSASESSPVAAPVLRPVALPIATGPRPTGPPSGLTPVAAPVVPRPLPAGLVPVGASNPITIRQNLGEEEIVTPATN